MQNGNGGRNQENITLVQMAKVCSGESFQPSLLLAVHFAPWLKISSEEEALALSTSR